MCRLPDFSAPTGQIKSVGSVALCHNPGGFGRDMMLCHEGFNEIDANSAWPAVMSGHGKTTL